jgi:hypothetical protein
LVVDGKTIWSSLTPYIEKGYVQRKRKREALEPECCAILEAVTSVQGDLIIYSDRGDLVNHLNGKIVS